jgi:hypothetical protein
MFLLSLGDSAVPDFSRSHRIDAGNYGDSPRGELAKGVISPSVYANAASYAFRRRSLSYGGQAANPPYRLPLTACLENPTASSLACVAGADAYAGRG